jgi:hypothetical protein
MTDQERIEYGRKKVKEFEEWQKKRRENRK